MSPTKRSEHSIKQTIITVMSCSIVTPSSFQNDIAIRNVMNVNGIVYFLSDYYYMVSVDDCNLYLLDKYYFSNNRLFLE